MLRKSLILLILPLMMMVGGAAVANDKQVRAVQVVDQLLINAHRALAGSRSNSELRGAVSSAFAFGVWERYLIEERAAAFSASQRQQFQSMLPGFMAHLYHQQFGRGLNQAPVLGEPRKVRRDVMVSSRFPRSNGGNLQVEWRVRDVPGQGSRVIDVMVGGTSFLLLKKEEFGAIIDSGGPEGLLTYMRNNSL